jgi:hypothetical protein
MVSIFFWSSLVYNLLLTCSISQDWLGLTLYWYDTQCLVFEPFQLLICPTAGGAAYYFAKQSINADRQARWEADQRRKQMTEALEYSNRPSPSNTRKNANLNGGPPREDHTGSPSQEATSDPAPTRHAPESEGQRVREKSKYEASEPYRAKKGDRFS